ncbi:MAG: DMT family transporter [Thermoanaerobaculia bacterium]
MSRSRRRPSWRCSRSRARATLPARTAALTAGALVAFAGNSWLCRAALRPLGGGRSIDPVSFTAVRIASGAAVLALLVLLRRRNLRDFRDLTSAGGFGSALALFAYAIAFSLAYLELGVGVGALIAFGAVQLTMLAGGLAAGRSPTLFEGLGLTLAVGGLATLALPGAALPSPLAACGMAVAGVAWGIYSLRGQKETLPPLAVTAGNFLRALPLALATLAIAALAAGDGALYATAPGLRLAVLSGALTSGVGYAIWYAALPGLAAVQAGLLQLAVPVLAALGGVLFLAEAWTVRLTLAAALVLCGIALALVGGAKGKKA